MDERLFQIVTAQSRLRMLREHVTRDLRECRAGLDETDVLSLLLQAQLRIEEVLLRAEAHYQKMGDAIPEDEARRQLAAFDARTKRERGRPHLHTVD